MERLKKILQQAKNDFPEEFQCILPCSSSNKHSWFIIPLADRKDIRFTDIECKKCKTNLAIGLKFFTGVQDHG